MADYDADIAASRATGGRTAPLAVVTGGSSGIGLELARIAAAEGHDLIVAADTRAEADSLKAIGGEVHIIETDLATPEGVRQVVAAVGDRPVAVLCANAGHGLGHPFLAQDFSRIRHLIDTNVTGTLDLVHQLAGRMARAGAGRILFTGSIAGTMPGTNQAAYNASKAFINSFAQALRAELRDSGVSVTTLMPGATDTRFFARAGLGDTEAAQQAKSVDPAGVAETGWKAMKAGKDAVVHGIGNKLRVAASHLVPDTVLAEQHRRMAEPGGARKPGGGVPIAMILGVVATGATAYYLLSRPDGRQDRRGNQGGSRPLGEGTRDREDERYWA
jgi:short-subunit dehydrogenase